MPAPARTARLVPVLVLSALLLSGLAAPIAVTRADEPGPALEPAEPSEAVGDVVELTVRFDDRGEATLSVNGSAHGATVALDDIDADGRALVRIHTSRSGRGAYDVDGAAARVDAGGALSPGSYALELAVDGEPADRANVTLHGASVDAVRVRRAPPSALDELDSPAAIRAAAENGSLTDASAVTPDETLVVGVDAGGLQGAYELSGADTDRGRFADALDATNATLVARRTTPEPDGEPLRFDLSNAASRVVADPRAGAYHLIVDAAAIGAGSTRGLRPGDELLVGFGFGVEAAAVDAEEATGNPRVAVGEFGVVAPRATLSTAEDRVAEFAPGADRRLRGETTLAPGSTLSVALAAPDGETIRRSTTVVADGNGSAFEAAVDLSGVAPPTALAVEFDRPDGDVAAAGDATVHVRSRAGSVELSNGTVDPRTARVRASAAHDAVVGLYARAPNGSRGPLLGEFPVPAGDAGGAVELPEPVGANRTVVAVLYRDADATGTFTDADEPYLVDGRAIWDARRGSAGAGEATATAATPATPANESEGLGTPAAPSATDPPSATDASRSSPTASRSDAASGSGAGSTAGTSPGFGAALAALAIGLLALAGRRRV